MPDTKPRKIFFGWWIVIVTSLISGLAMVFVYQGASVLFKPIAADLGLDRTAASVASGVGSLAVGVMFTFAGWLTVKYGPKWVVCAGSCVMGLGMVLMTLISSAPSYYIVWGLLISTGNVVGYSVAIDASLTNWFVRKRGLAFSVKWGIISLVGTAALPLLSWLIEAHGWRLTCVIWGAAILVCTPLLTIFIRQKRPEYYGLLPDGASPQAHAGSDTLLATGEKYAADIHETEYTFRQAVGTSSFWLINAGWVVQTVIAAGFHLHIVPFLTDSGITPIQAGSMLALMLFLTMPSRIFGGLIADRLKKEKQRYLLAASFFLQAAGLAVLLLSPTMTGIYVMLVIYGLGYGAYTPLDTLIRARYFGRKSYGSIQGIATALSTPFSFFAPIYAGWIYDTTGTYGTAFALFAILAAVGTVLMCLIRVPRPLSSVLMRGHRGNLSQSA